MTRRIPVSRGDTFGRLTARIVIDTREQQPLTPAIFRSPGKVKIDGKDRALPPDWYDLPTVRAALPAGDYSIEGMETSVAIERKSISDLAGTLYGSTTDSMGERKGNLERFERELQKLQSYAFRAWVIEASPDDFEGVILHRFRHVHPVHAYTQVTCIANDYRIPIVWAGTRIRAGHFVGVSLNRIIEQNTDSAAADKATRRGLELPWIKKASQGS